MPRSTPSSREPRPPAAVEASPGFVTFLFLKSAVDSRPNPVTSEVLGRRCRALSIRVRAQYGTPLLSHFPSSLLVLLRNISTPFAPLLQATAVATDASAAALRTRYHSRSAAICAADAARREGWSAAAERNLLNLVASDRAADRAERRVDPQRTAHLARFDGRSSLIRMNAKCSRARRQRSWIFLCHMSWVASNASRIVPCPRRPLTSGSMCATRDGSEGRVRPRRS